MRTRIASGLLTAVLAILGLATVFPFVWMVLSAFKSNKEINSPEQTFLPTAWTLENFASIEEKFDFIRLFGNSVFLSVVITAIVLYTSALAGFVIAKYRFRGRGLLFGFTVGTMMIPWAVTIIPRYTMFVDAGLQDNYLSIIIPAAISGFGIFMMRQNMHAVPDEVLPMSVNSIAALAIFQFLWVWDDYLWPYLMISDNANQVLAVGLTTFAGQYGTDYGGLFAATTISVLPVIIVYIIFQRRFVAGVASAAVK
jgi:ABC-type glycerol-3-phosphate transport system permease component